MAGNADTTDEPSPPATPAAGAERKPLTPAAQRALAEAEARRQAAAGQRQARAKGIAGPEGPGTDALWRLGEQGHRLGFLSADLFNPVHALAEFGATHPSFGNMSPFDRINTYRGRPPFRQLLAPPVLGGRCPGYSFWAWRRRRCCRCGNGCIGRPRPHRSRSPHSPGGARQRDDLEDAPEIPASGIRSTCSGPSMATPSRRGCICGPGST